MADAPHIKYFNMGQWPVYVGFTTSAKAFRREMKRLGIGGGVEFLARSGANASTHFFERANEMSCIIITMEKRGKRPVSQYAALLAHEALHAMQEMHRNLNRGEPFGDEADAYLLQSIVQSCLQEALEEGVERSIEP